MGTKEDPFWQGSGRTIFAEAAYLMRNDPNRSYSKLVDTLLSIKIENPEMENRLSAVLAAREAEGRQMASLFEPDVPEVVSGEDVTQAEQPQQPVSPAINDKKSDSGVNVPAGGIEQELKMKPEEEMEQQLPPGISESGEVVDMAAYEAWQQENHPDIQQQMQRREEVNINVHRERGEDVEPGDDF